MEKLLILLLLHGIHINGGYCKSISLFPIKAEVNINKTITLTCTYNGYEEVIGTKWNVNNKYTPSVVRKTDGTCIGNGAFSYDTIFKVSCPSNTSFTVSIIRAQLSDHNASWQCFDRERTSNTVTIIVNVPAVTVVIRSNASIYMREYQPQLSTCTTSACRPTPTVKWYIRHFKENITVDMTAHSKQRYNQHDNGLVSSESILEFLPNRTINNWTLFCEVRTQMEYADISSKEIVLNVSYPPESLPFIHGFTNDTVPRVVESEPNTLSCSVTGGNPLATLTLTCFNKRSTTSVITNRTVTATITWKAKRNQNNCTCESNHIISGKEITNVKFEVLFPPGKVHFTISGQGPEGTTYAVNNNEDVSLICFTESNPNPDIIITNAKNERLVLLKNTTILRHTLRKVSCVDAGEYECSARNVVTTGHEAKSTLILIVKCLPKPATDSIKESNIAAIPYTDVTLQFIAKNYFDEQNKTQFTWYKQNTSLHYDSSKYMILSYGLQSVLIVKNVTQSDYGQYRVVVRNSVGQYIHYFELHMMEQESSVDSSTNMGTTIGVAVGTFVFTILCIVLGFVGYKYIRRKRNLQHQYGGTPATGNVTESQTTPTYDYINPSTDSKNVYQELGDTSKEGHAYMEMRSANTDDSTRNYINMTL